MVDEDGLVEPLSPELALVDPDLARVARDRLPPFGETPSSVGRASLSDKDIRQTSVAHSWSSDLDQGPRPENSLSATSSFTSEARSVPDSAVNERPLRAAHRPRRRIRVVLAALGVTVAAIAVYGLVPDSAVHNEARDRALKKAPANAPTAPQRPVLGATTAQTRATYAREERFSTSHVFIWPAVSHAHFYEVEFFREGTEVFRALSSRARLELPTRWIYRGHRYHLVAGTYSWRVSPAFGPESRLRYGNPIIVSNWVFQP